MTLYYRNMNECMNEKISIISAVYQVKPYLSQFLDSILAQTYRDWKLYVVDDGSTDGSAAVLDDYARHDARISVIRQKNRGLALARQKALDLCTGEYIYFADSDDWLEPNLLQRMLDTMEQQQSDVVIIDYYRNEGDRQTYHQRGKAPVENLTTHEVLLDIYCDRISCYMWTYMMKRSIPQERIYNDIFEDHSTILKWMSHARKVTLLHEPLYHYRQRAGSILHSINSVRINTTLFRVVLDRYDFLRRNHLLEDCQSKVDAYTIHVFLKLCKDISRSNASFHDKMTSVHYIRRAIKAFPWYSPVSLGTKYYLRQCFMRMNPKLFVHMADATSLFSHPIPKLERKLRRKH